MLWGTFRLAFEKSINTNFSDCFTYTMLFKETSQWMIFFSWTKPREDLMLSVQLSIFVFTMSVSKRENALTKGIPSGSRTIAGKRNELAPNLIGCIPHLTRRIRWSVPLFKRLRQWPLCINSAHSRNLYNLLWIPIIPSGFKPKYEAESSNTKQMSKLRWRVFPRPTHEGPTGQSHALIQKPESNTILRIGRI